MRTGSYPVPNLLVATAMPEKAIAATELEALAEELLATFRTALAQPDFGPKDSFLDAGGDSLTVVEVIFHIEANYGVSLSTTEFMALASAERLAQHIVKRQRESSASKESAHKSPATEPSLLSLIQDGVRPHPLVCAYGLDGESAYAITLASMLPADQPVGMLNLRADKALSKGVQPFRKFTVDDAALVSEQFHNRPCVLLGYSLGAHVALAISHELAQRGVSSRLIAVLDDDAELDRRYFGALRQSHKPANVRTLLALAKECSPAEPIAAHVIYFRSTENEADYRSDPTCGWGEIATGGVTVIDIPASHWGIVREPGLRHIAPRLAEAIAAPRPIAPMPDAARMLRFAARLAAREGDLPGELKYLKRAIHEDRDQPSWLYANLAAALFLKGDTGAALATLAEARHRESWPLALDLRFLREFEQRGLKEELEGVVRRLSAMRPDHPSVHRQMAIAYQALGLPQQSERHLRAGLAMQPMHQELSFMLVRELRLQNAWSDLRQVCEQLVGAFPGEGEPRAALIDAYVNLGMPLLALQFRDAIMSASPVDIDGLLALANALLHSGRKTEALEVADLAVEHEPDSQRTYRQRAVCLSALGRMPEATAAFRLAGLAVKPARAERTSRGIG